MERTEDMKREMAEHFEEFEYEYRNELQAHEVVYEYSQVVVVSDHTGLEINEWAQDFDVSRTEFSELMHMLARQVCDYTWSVFDPIVFDKFE